MNNLQALNGLLVLAVDDNADNLELIKFVLEEHNAQVTLAASANAALEAIAHQKPNILISDIGMPDEDGYSLIRKIRNLTQHGKRIPAIALTAHASKEARIFALNAGFSTHLAKPFDLDELIAVVSALTITLQNRVNSHQYSYSGQGSGVRG